MKFKIGLVAASLLGAIAASPAASAMPVAPAPEVSSPGVEQVRMVCNAWGRCWWRPDYGYYAPRYYAPRYYGPPRYYGYYGYRRW